VYGAAGLGQPARLRPDGTVLARQRVWDGQAQGFPPGTDTELLVEIGGILPGRFLITPAAAARPLLERRLLAIAFAGQIGAALASGQPVDH
jgi:hypothetical protein